jgi:hypothetical protein
MHIYIHLYIHLSIYRDRNTACVFLSNTCSIVESTWDSAKLVKLTDEQYVFKFPTLPIPGFEPITPEIEV